MWPESSDLKPSQNTALRTGLTTGTCATAACVAAAYSLLSNQNKKIVSVTLPKGKVVELTITTLVNKNKSACAATIKDAGDDPDVTHGAKVFVNLSLTKEACVVFFADAGVGTVTRSGLLLDVDEPAINPVPRQMMEDHLLAIAKEFNYLGGFHVSVGVEGGEQLALKTMNGRLGILGGLSILGTTGIVRPFSCSAYIASIHQGIDVATSNGYQHISASTGNSSETFIKQQYDLPDMAMIEMGDFVGAVLKYLKKVPVKKLSICGGFGKISKLANGNLDLHSKKSEIDFSQFSILATKEGAADSLLSSIQNANTSIEVLSLCNQNQIDLGSLICEQALVFVKTILPKEIEVEVWAIDRSGSCVGKAK